MLVESILRVGTTRKGEDRAPGWIRPEIKVTIGRDR